MQIMLCWQQNTGNKPHRDRRYLKVLWKEHFKVTWTLICSELAEYIFFCYGLNSRKIKNIPSFYCIFILSLCCECIAVYGMEVVSCNFLFSIYDSFIMVIFIINHATANIYNNSYNSLAQYFIILFIIVFICCFFSCCFGTLKKI